MSETEYAPATGGAAQAPTQSAGAAPASRLKDVAGTSGGFEAQAARLSPVQRRAVQAKGGEDTASVHEAAAHGLSGSGGALPHGAEIQKSFGAYDISHVRAHSDAKADEGARDMGALAYTQGKDIASRGTMDKRTAAHEVTHVIQQQAGVSLSGGVGAAGDKYEQHADKVADAVMAGKSAEPILAEMGGGPSAKGVQKMAVQRVVAGPAPTDSTSGNATPATPPSSPAPAAPTRPTTDDDYKAVPDWGTFRERVVVDLGKSESEALGLWKSAIDSIQVAQDKWAALNENWSAMTAWVDTAGRVPFEAIGAQLLPSDFPQPGVKYNLWSGGDAAQHYAAARGTILETSACGKVFNRLKVTDESRWGINQSVWRGLSRAYAMRIPIIAEGIDVYQRKQGDIFAQIEAPAVQERARAAGVDASFNFIALVADGRFGKDSRRDGPNTNEVWRERLTAAAGGDAALAQAKAPKLFVDVTASDLTEAGAFQDNPAGWQAAIDGHETALIAALTAAEGELVAARATPGGPGSTLTDATGAAAPGASSGGGVGGGSGSGVTPGASSGGGVGGAARVSGGGA
jgi:hypothetical protein